MSHINIIRTIQKVAPEFQPGPTASTRINGYIHKTQDAEEIVKLLQQHHDLQDFRIYGSSKIRTITKELERALK